MEENEILYYTCPGCGANLDLDEVCDDCYNKQKIQYPCVKNYKTVSSTNDERND